MLKENERLEQLERTLLELGTEMFKTKNEVLSIRDYHEKFVKIVDGLKKILDEKGLITTEDFENAVDLGEAISMNAHSVDSSIELELEKLKKASH